MSRPTSIVTLGEETDKLRTINIGIYGPPGIGKTVLAGSGGKGTLILDSDHGVDSAEALGSDADTMPVTDYEQLQSALDYLKNDKHSYTFVWWDSLTLFQDRTLVDEILVDAHIENPRQSEDVASQREYLISQNRIGRYIREFVALPINFGFTAHVMTGPSPQDDSELIYMPMIQGKKGEYASKICGYMNVIGYMGFVKVQSAQGNTRTVQRVLFQHTATHYAKDRFHALGPHMDKPTIPRIVEAVATKRPGIPGSTIKKPDLRVVKKAGR